MKTGFGKKIRELVTSRKQPKTRRNSKSRKSFFETLETRSLLAGDLNVAESLAEGEASCNYSKRAALSAELPVGTNRNAFFNCARANSAATGEGTSFIFTSEAEPNNTISMAGYLPVGLGAGQTQEVNLSGGLTNGDLDVFRLRLNGGDILGVNITGAGDLSLQDPAGNEYIGSQQDAGIGYPASSPLPKGGTVSISYVIPATGDYYLQIASGITGAAASSYSAKAQVFRPVLESEATGTRQVLFLDFNGATLDTSIFGGTGVARLSPIRNFLAGWGLQPENENQVIDAIINQVKLKFDEVRQAGNNGDFRSTGRPGSFDIEILNSRDNPDPWGLPNVSRIIIGGSITELQIPTIGIAESIDVGNFKTNETAVTLLDLYSAPATDLNSVNSVRRAPGVSIYDVIARLVGNTTVHEAGHFFGLWHTDNANNVRSIIDQGGDPASVKAGAGPDGILGTIDDTGDRKFVSDNYVPNEGFTGVEDTLNAISWSLASGKVPTGVQGTVFLDANGNGRIDAEHGIPNWTIYSDQNSNGLLDASEPRTLTAFDGSYVLYVPPGTHRITALPQGSYNQTTPTTNVNLNGRGTFLASVAKGQTIGGYNFGERSQGATLSGVKWQDVNGDGIRDPGDKGVAGFTMYWDVDDDNELDIGEPAAITNEFGQYVITTYDTGTHAVRELGKAGWTITFPSATINPEQEYVVTVVAGADIRDLNFGNRGPLFDFGDAPIGYPVLLAENGARTPILDGFHLGPTTTPTDPNQTPGVGVDGELNGQHDAGALADDNAGVDDEDGIVISQNRPLIAGSTSTLTAIVSVGTNPSGYLNGWIDFNNDKDWDDAGERVITAKYLGEGSWPISIVVPAGASLGTAFARFRLGYNPNIGPTGADIAGGEIEDYAISIVNNQPKANPDAFTVSQNSRNNEFNVLVNDSSSSAGGLQIQSLGAPNSGGTVSVDNKGTTDPSDDVVIYSPANGFIGTETFTYSIVDAAQKTSSTTVTVTVLSALDNPIAVDDSVFISTTGIATQVNVLANDIGGSKPPIRITAVDQTGLAGFASVTIAPDRLSLFVTVTGSTAGDRQFEYTISDGATPTPRTSKAKVTIHFGSLSSAICQANSDSKVAIRLQAFDLSGQPITTVNPQQEFFVRAFAQDLRASDGVADNVDRRGIGAAFLDLLYQSDLVTPVGSIIYDPQFTFQKQGSIATPGLIDEAGAAQAQPTVFKTSQYQIFSIRMRANANGEARFIPDPADLSPASDLVLLEPPVPVVFSEIDYCGTSVFIGDPSQVLFKAIDDSFNVSAGSTSTLQVLNNDLEGLYAPATITSVVPVGTTVGNAAVSLDGRSVTYTVGSGVSAVSQFRYTIRNTNGTTDSAVVTVNVGTPVNPLVEISMVVTDTNGNPITQITKGGTFQVRAFVQDKRTDDGDGNPQTDNRGVYAAFFDMLYSRDKANNLDIVRPVTLPPSTNPLGFDITFGGFYGVLPSGSAALPGLIDEVGSVEQGGAGSTPLGAGKVFLFRMTFTAENTGTVNFAGDPRDSAPFHDVLLWNLSNPVPLSQVAYIPASITVVSAAGGEYTNTSYPEDVNGDGVVSPIDALLIINNMNSAGIRQLAGEGEATSQRFFWDVNGDKYITPLDALMVINKLNQTNNRAGEGEAADVGEVQALATIQSAEIQPAHNSVIDSVLVTSVLAAGDLQSRTNSSSAPIQGSVAAMKTASSSSTNSTQLPALVASANKSSTTTVEANGTSKSDGVLEDILDALAVDVTRIWN